MTAVKQLINTLYMYVYLVYYTERLRRDKQYMIKEILRVRMEQKLARREQYKREINWKV